MFTFNNKCIIFTVTKSVSDMWLLKLCLNNEAKRAYIVEFFFSFVIGNLHTSLTNIVQNFLSGFLGLCAQVHKHLALCWFRAGSLGNVILLWLHSSMKTAEPMCNFKFYELFFTDIFESILLLMTVTPSWWGFLHSSGKDTNQALCVVPSILPELPPLQQRDIFSFGTGALHSECLFA